VLCLGIGVCMLMCVVGQNMMHGQKNIKFKITEFFRKVGRNETKVAPIHVWRVAVSSTPS